MKSVVPELEVKDKVVIVGQNEVNKFQKLISSVRPFKGHTLFEVDLNAKEIREAEFEDEPAQFVKEANIKTQPRAHGVITKEDGTKKLVLPKQHVRQRKVLKNEGCIYISALNKKNVYKRLIKLGIVRLIKMDADTKRNTKTINS